MVAICRTKVKKRARILSKAEFRRMLKVCTVTREAERNQLILCLSFALGLRVTELGSITIRDIMFPSGRLKTELTLRSDITKNAHVRTVPMISRLLIAHLEKYLDYRIEHGIGVIPVATEEFRNLSPDMPVVFSNRGSGFVMATKRRVLQDGTTEIYKACDALEQLFRDLYQRGGYKGASSHSGRRSYATRLIQAGAEIEDVSHLLGHASVEFTRPYLEPDTNSIRNAYEFALSGMPEETTKLNNSEVIDLDAQFKKLEHQKFEKTSGVYFLINNAGEVVYVGQSGNISVRLTQHYANNNMSPFFSKVAVLPVTDSEERLKIESQYIVKFDPPLNKTKPSVLKQSTTTDNIGTSATSKVNNVEESRKTASPLRRKQYHSKKSG